VTHGESDAARGESGASSEVGTPSDPVRGWKIAGLIASLVIVSTIPLYAIKESRLRATRRSVTDSVPTFVGRSQCISCHEAAYRSWRGSDHDNAMDVANDSTVLGDFDDAVFETMGVTSRFYRKDGGFFVRTEGPDGELADFEIAYTFGIEPLQQYLIRFPGGRLQALSLAWDVEQGRWFRMYPGQEIPHDDWLHWTKGGQNWNGMCAECHSTNLVKGYDPATKTFDTSWSEIDVSCEACHGPGSAHVEWAEIEPMARPRVDNYALVVRTSGIASRQQVELCAPCHSRRTELGGYDHTGADLLDHHIPSLLDEGLYYSDGQILDEVYVYGSFLQSKMYRNNVRCSDCHDVHSLQLLREGNALCLQCHTAAVYDSSDHHFHKKIYEGEPSDGALCVKCHMPERPYMVIDERADHSLRVPRPDLTLELGVPNACGQSGCHDDKSAQWAADYFTRWYGVARRSHYGTVLEAGRRGAPEAGPELIRLAGDPLYPAIVRATALSLLGRYPGEASTRAFNSALADDDALVRHTAVQAVNTADPRELVELVAPLLADPAKAVRGQAAVRLAPVPRELFKPYQSAALDSALNEYRTAMSYTLDFAASGHNLGNLYATLGDPAKAEEYYRTALEIDDLFYPAKMNLAVLYNRQGRNAEAETLLREVLGAYPEVYEAAYSLGLLLVEMGRPGEAVEFLAQAADGMPERSRVPYNLGLLLQSLGRWAEAEAALRRALELEPESLDYLYALADHYVKRGEPARALPLAERMIAAHPDDSLGPELKTFLQGALQARN
jgi:tetratricopeptide (TPR) repeat protein